MMSRQEAQSAAFAGATGEAYITTVAQPYAGFVVAIPLPQRAGEYLRRVFAGLRQDQNVYLQRAKRWRDAAYKRLYGTAPPVRAFHESQSNGMTGVPGVRLKVRRIRSRHDRNRFYDVPVFIAEVWLEPGRDRVPPKGSRSKQFAISKYGHDEAFRRAVQWREEAKLALKHGHPLP